MIRRITGWNFEPREMDLLHSEDNEIKTVEIGSNVYRTYCPVGQYIKDHVDYLINISCIGRFYADKDDLAYYNYGFVISDTDIYDENFGFVSKWVRKEQRPDV